MAIKPGSGIFKFLYKLHIYGGMLSVPFFIIIGITSLNYNHHEWFKKEKFKEKTYYASFSYKSDSTELLIDRALDTLQIFGHRPFWLQQRDKENNFHFQINRPGKQYKIVLLEKENKLKITEINMGLIHALSGMHVSSSGLPKSTAFTVWSVYAHIAVIFGLLSIILSIYFWFKKSKFKKAQWIIAGSVFTVSFSYILFIWLVG